MTSRNARTDAALAAITARLDGVTQPAPAPAAKPAPVPSWRSTAPTVEERDREEQAALDKLRRLHRPRPR